MARMVPFTGRPGGGVRRRRPASGPGRGQHWSGWGYSRAGVLEGGMNRWAAAGYATEWGMNVFSKEFGERGLGGAPGAGDDGGGAA